MPNNEQCNFEDMNWELPSFATVRYANKLNDYALVIPVINEGERIKEQLKKIHNAQLLVDVIIADGGSSDRSLEPDYMYSVNVTAVLTKTGPGKLSAQLRAAYAWCLRQGYKGIITIDGNGKDGIEAVTDMVDKLNEGYDYVQGSRYLPGGAVENTPLERTIGNRLIHAPLLSIAGRHWYTDTTNGFRAYSAKYLLDPRVQPFRDVFQRYELLFYLTIRAGQIGMKIGHVPVCRRYPPSGAIPTKIVGFKPKLRLLAEALNAASGGYTLGNSGKDYPSFFSMALVTLLILLPLFIASIIQPQFGPDSWAYYELAKTVGDKFYEFSHFRSYWSELPYSASFPPLFPILIALFDLTFGAGARSAIYISFISFFAFTLISEKIGRIAFGVPLLGLSLALLLTVAPNMLISELSAGRTIPLQLFLFSIVFVLLLQQKHEKWIWSVSIGIICGFCVLNRFDAIILPILIASLVLFLTCRFYLSITILALSLVLTSPWIAFSLVKFGLWFATDNAATALAVDPAAYVTDWWPEEQASIKSNFTAWLSRICLNAVKFTRSLIASGVNLMGAALLIAGLPILVTVSLRSKENIPYFYNMYKNNYKFRVMFLLSIVMFFSLLPQLLSGYRDHRYFTPWYYSSFFVISGYILLKANTNVQREIFARFISSIFLIFSLYNSMNFLANKAANERLDYTRWTEFENPDEVRTIAECIHKQGRSSRILVLGDNNIAARLGALGSLHTMMEPKNMSDGRLGSIGSRAFLDFWDVSFVLVASPERYNFAMNTFDLHKVSFCPHLYLVSKSQSDK
jgi:glycosyltransferase involved in cell wall biosynthesis